LALKVLECDATAKMPNGLVRVINTRMGQPKSSITFRSPTPNTLQLLTIPLVGSDRRLHIEMPHIEVSPAASGYNARVAASGLPMPTAGANGGAAVLQHSRAAVSTGGAASRGSR
jgi:hypothetical protein